MNLNLSQTSAQRHRTYFLLNNKAVNEASQSARSWSALIGHPRVRPCATGDHNMRTGSDAYSRRRRTSAYYVAGGLLLGGVFATAVLLPSTADRQPAALSIEDLYSWVCASLGWGTTTLEEQILATGERAAGQERGIIHKKEEFEPPPDMPKGTKCTYMDKWLENAFNSMLEKLVEAIMMAPVLTSLPMELWVQVGPVKAAVRNMTLVGLQLGQIRMGAKTGRSAAASLLCLEPSRIFP